MRSSLSGAGVMLALVLAVLLPPVAHGEEDQTLSITGFRLEASNGYDFFAWTEVPAPGDEGWITVSLRGRRAAVGYTAPATVSRRTIDANLGKLGRISVTRAPTGHMKTVRQGCKPGSTMRVEAERYEGTIEFHGEEGFTDVSVTSAPVEDLIFCGVGEEGGRPPGERLPGARLDVEKRRRSEEYRLEFDAAQSRPGARTAVSAEVSEQRGEMGIQRATWTWASAGALRYDRHLRIATVRPPAPFAGHGSFHSNARGANRWTGNLTVDLPGRSDVPITGPGFWASLERPRR